MYEIESVLMDNDETVDEEYLDENEQHQSSQELRQESPPKRKIPIIRRPGEVVTPIHTRHPGSVKVAPSIFVSTPTVPRVTPNGRTKKTWQKVAPCSINIPLKPTTSSAPPKRITPSKRVQPDGDDEDDDRNGFEAAYCQVKIEPSPKKRVTLESLDAKLDALDEKLNGIVARLGEHDGTLNAVKLNIKHLRNDLTTYAEATQREEQAKTRAPKRWRQPQVVFPLADDNYLLRLEELVQADNDIREELYDRFMEAPGTDVFSYMRKNVGYLFKNTSKYTWTGRPSNSNKDAEPSGVANQLTLVDVLIDSGCEKFGNCSRDYMEREFRRSLQRFNDAKYFKRRKRALERLAEAAARDEQEEDEGEEREDEEKEGD